MGSGERDNRSLPQPQPQPTTTTAPMARGRSTILQSSRFKWPHVVCRPRFQELDECCIVTEVQNRWQNGCYLLLSVSSKVYLHERARRTRVSRGHCRSSYGQLVVRGIRKNLTAGLSWQPRRPPAKHFARSRAPAWKRCVAFSRSLRSQLS